MQNGTATKAVNFYFNLIPAKQRLLQVKFEFPTYSLINSQNSHKLTFSVVLYSIIIIMRDIFGKLKIFRKGKLLKEKISDKLVKVFPFADLH